MALFGALLSSRYSASACRAWPRLARRRARIAISRVSPGSSSSTHCSAAQGSMPAPVMPPSAPPGRERRGRLGGAVPSEEIAPACGVAGHRLADRVERGPSGELGVEGVRREDRLLLAVELGAHLVLGVLPQHAEGPFDVGGDGEPARSVGPRLVTRSTASFTGASSAMPSVRWVAMPPCSCSNVEEPAPCRTVYGASSRIGPGVAHHSSPVSSSCR